MEVKSLDEITLKLETINPYLLLVQIRNIENEGLRAPSLRGLLRWWFRAILLIVMSVDQQILRVIDGIDKYSKFFF